MGGGVGAAASAMDVEREMEEDELSPIEQVRLTVMNSDDPSLPVWTFRMWSLGLLSCCLLSFLNQFFGYRSQPLIITQITVQVASLPLGHFLARVLPTTRFRLPGLGAVSLNPGPFNMKEHVLISIFANAGAAFGNGSAYAVGIVNIIKAFYGRSISFIASWLLITTTQVLGYGWAGLMRRYVVEPAHMWWPSTLVQVSLFRALHEKEDRRMSRAKFFVIALICSFTWYTVPGYFFPTITNISWVCWVFSKSVTAQQIGSGLQGLGVGAFTLDWAAVASFLFSPLICPFFAIVNVLIGYALLMYVAIPLAYWGFNLYNAKAFPIFSSDLFTAAGQPYNITAIVNNQFEINMAAYEQQGRINLSMFFALSYGFGFSAITATLTHVCFFYGREIYERFRASYKGKPDIHTRLMKKYENIPEWWFYLLLAVTFTVSLILCTVLNDQVHLPWWGLIFACGMAFVFTLPISIITATTNQTPGLNIITEYIMGLIQPGKPISNVCFKVYGYMSMAQAVSFLADFKLGHYMKIPPKSMFLVQFIGTIIAGTINLGVAWWLLGSIKNICHPGLLPPNSPWTCPSDRVFFDASVIWGLVGPRRIFGPKGNYGSLNWFFLVGALGPIIVWLFHKAFPRQSWIPLINLPVLLGATGMMPPATPLNFSAWIAVGTAFNFFVFRYRKKWWERYNYILSAALDAGVAFMGVLLYFALSMENKSITWWGAEGEHCPLASCPTAKGVQVDGCPQF
ncbi:oligopeptide transporter [Musa troglodytarum]|uniref:Oligopeptide transporter n=1 Tax=Musa troglodytarum TaxID=320322 RepID=A0A9E7FRT9_9LILI|nr:oligopeptide transporter [Musa troglodytarum]